MTDQRLLRCPACDGPMQQVDRRGVLIDLCRDCRGVFLDRGELDKLLDEAAAQQPVPLDAAPPPPSGGLATEADRLAGRGDDLRYGDRDRPYRDDDDDDYARGGRRGRRRRGWLDDVFDFD